MYGIDFNKEIHAFQFSISNVLNKDIEKNVPDIWERIKLFKYLKNKGFRVSIRIQPFIPNITTIEIIELFKEADHFTIEGLKLIPQDKELINKILLSTDLNINYFENVGLYNLKRDFRDEYYAPFIEIFKKYKKSFSIADNDWHNESTDSCCCGDVVSFKTTTFNDTALFKKYGLRYKISDIKNEIPEYLKPCLVKYLFASNRQDGFNTIEEYFDIKFKNKTSPSSTIKNKYYEEQKKQLKLF